MRVAAPGEQLRLRDDHVLVRFARYVGAARKQCRICLNVKFKQTGQQASAERSPTRQTPRCRARRHRTTDRQAHKPPQSQGDAPERERSPQGTSYGPLYRGRSRNRRRPAGGTARLRPDGCSQAARLSRGSQEPLHSRRRRPGGTGGCGRIMPLAPTARLEHAVGANGIISSALSRPAARSPQPLTSLSSPKPQLAPGHLTHLALPGPIAQSTRSTVRAADRPRAGSGAIGMVRVLGTRGHGRSGRETPYRLIGREEQEMAKVAKAGS